MIHLGFFLAWMLLGAVFSYGSLYVLTPFGFAILAPAILIALLVNRLDTQRSAGRWGVIAGPGLACIVVASSGVENAGAWMLAGAVLILIAGAIALIAAHSGASQGGAFP